MVARIRKDFRRMPKKKNGFLPRVLDFLREEAPFLAGAMTLAAFHLGGDAWLEGLTDSRLAAFLFIWLFVAALWSAFGVVHHADALAKLLGEPFGTVILTLAVVGIEVSLIASVMLSGEAAPTLARETMMAVLMIVLNGLVGTALLIGGWKHGEQDYNLQGARVPERPDAAGRLCPDAPRPDRVDLQPDLCAAAGVVRRGDDCHALRRVPWHPDRASQGILPAARDKCRAKTAILAAQAPLS
jgi:hypothetical protein